MSEVSTKPYLIRALYEWCTDAGFTPYIAVAVDESVRVPVEFVKNGEIVLNVSALATNHLKLGNETIEFQARFGGVPREVYVPIARVIAIYARENGQGMAFDIPKVAPTGVEPAPAPAPQATGPRAVEAPRERVELVPVANPPPGDDPNLPPTPRPGERPKLTRIK
jgi:stringent starvation protein B